MQVGDEHSVSDCTERSVSLTNRLDGSTSALPATRLREKPIAPRSKEKASEFSGTDGSMTVKTNRVDYRQQEAQPRLRHALRAFLVGWKLPNKRSLGHIRNEVQQCKARVNEAFALAGLLGKGGGVITRQFEQPLEALRSRGRESTASAVCPEQDPSKEDLYAPALHWESPC